MKSSAQNGRARRLAAVALVMLGLPVVLWLGAAVLIADQIRYPAFLSSPRGDDIFGARVPDRTGHPYDLARSAIGLMPDEFKAGQVEFAGLPVDVTGLFFRGRRNATIILVPGAGSSTEALIPCAKFLYDAGYSIVALNSLSNAHLGTDFGWSEREVVLKAAQKLKHDGIAQIGVLGISEGGAAAIFGASEEPQLFSAIVVDSSYSNLDTLLRRSPSISGINPAFAATAMWIGEHRWFPRPFDEIAPADAAHNIACPVLVIQNVGDPITPVGDGQAIEFAARKAGNRTDLWIAPTHGHGDALFEVPDEYQKRVLDFFASAMK